MQSTVYNDIYSQMAAVITSVSAKSGSNMRPAGARTRPTDTVRVRRTHKPQQTRQHAARQLSIAQQARRSSHRAGSDKARDSGHAQPVAQRQEIGTQRATQQITLPMTARRPRGWHTPTPKNRRRPIVSKGTALYGGEFLAFMLSSNNQYEVHK